MPLVPRNRKRRAEPEPSDSEEDVAVNDQRGSNESRRTRPQQPSRQLQDVVGGDAGDNERETEDSLSAAGNATRAGQKRARSTTPPGPKRRFPMLSSEKMELAKKVLGKLAIAPVVPDILATRDHWTEGYLEIVRGVLESDWTLLDDFNVVLGMLKGPIGDDEEEDIRDDDQSSGVGSEPERKKRRVQEDSESDVDAGGYETAEEELYGVTPPPPNANGYEDAEEEELYGLTPPPPNGQRSGNVHVTAPPRSTSPRNAQSISPDISISSLPGEDNEADDGNLFTANSQRSAFGSSNAGNSETGEENPATAHLRLQERLARLDGLSDPEADFEQTFRAAGLDRFAASPRDRVLRQAEQNLGASRRLRADIQVLRNSNQTLRRQLEAQREETNLQHARNMYDELNSDTPSQTCREWAQDQIDNGDPPFNVEDQWQEPRMFSDDELPEEEEIEEGVYYIGPPTRQNPGGTPDAGGKTVR